MKTSVARAPLIGPGSRRWPAGDTSGRRLLEACESLYERLRRSVGLTFFRIELQHATAPLVVSLHAPDALAWSDPRHEWMRSGPACLEFVLRGDDQRVLAYVRIEDGRRGHYPDNARVICERIASEYLSEFAGVLNPAAATPRPFLPGAAAPADCGGAAADRTEA